MSDAEMKLQKLEEGERVDGVSPGKAEIGSAAHIQEVEARRCVKVRHPRTMPDLPRMFAA